MALSGTSGTKKGIARWQQATALVPLVLLAGAWSASLGASSSATANSPVQDPGVPAVPTTSFDQPASVTRPPTPDATSDPGLDPSAPSSESVNGIPTAAMVAYQRAETVLAKADASCGISWALIAAIGRVESDHGRYGGNVIGTDGRSEPGIYGIALDGSNNTTRISDTDNGTYDNDTVYDRAVGPMQFIPGTWEIVGVDGDGDGVRDPQDIDDAALAAAVYLCAGEQDLSTLSGQRAAVFSYNHSNDYVDLVLSIMDAYLDGDYTTVADGLPNSQYVAASPAVDRREQPRTGKQPKSGSTPPVNAPHNPPTPQPPPPTNPSPAPAPTDPTPSDPVPNQPTNDPAPTVPDPTTVVTPVVKRLETLAEAVQFCASHLPGDPSQEMIEACGKALMGKTNKRAATLLSGSLSDVLKRLGLGDLLPPLEPPCVPLPGFPCD